MLNIFFTMKFRSIQVFQSTVKDSDEINTNIYFFKIIFAGAGFSNIPGKYENVVFIIKNPRNRNKCFKSNPQIMENTKYYEISTIYECIEK